MTPRAAGVALGLALSVLPTHAFAQNAEPRITIGIGAGPVHPLARVAQTVAPTWSIDFQARLTKHLILGATVSSWHHVLPGFPVDGDLGPEFGPPSIGPHLAMHSIMFTALATTTFHRVHLSSGAAIGFAAVTAEPESIHTLGIQGLLGAGVQLTRRLEVFALYSLADSSGFVTVSLIGGVRVGFHQ